MLDSLGMKENCKFLKDNAAGHEMTRDAENPSNVVFSIHTWLNQRESVFRSKTYCFCPVNWNVCAIGVGRWLGFFEVFSLEG